MESCQYRGYQIEARRMWSNWRVNVYRTHSDLPILPQPTLHTSTMRWARPSRAFIAPCQTWIAGSFSLLWLIAASAMTPVLHSPKESPASGPGFPPFRLTIFPLVRANLSA